MGLHHEANHGRVFRGIDATNHLKMQKRNSRTTHDRIVMHVPDRQLHAAQARPADAAQTLGRYVSSSSSSSTSSASITLDFVNKAQDDSSDVVTSYAVVYKTLSADFTGSIAGYTTLSDVETTPTNIVQSGATATAASAASSTAGSQQSSYESAKSAAQQAATTASSAAITSAATVSPVTSSIMTTTFTDDDGSNNKSNFLNHAGRTSATSSATVAAAAVTGGAVGGTPLSATREAQISNESSGMSAGGKAGLAIGIILAIALAAGLLFFCWRRRRNQNAHQELGNEKRASNNSSLFGGAGMWNEKRSSAISEKVAPSIRSAATAPRLSLRPVTQFLPNLGSNRNAAGDNDAAAAMSEKPKSMWERRSQNTENPFEDHNEKPENPFDEPEGRVSPEPPTPKSTKFGTASAVAVAAAGNASTVPSPPKGPNNVHRVQLDFKPSMDDELELKSGQLVRMLHEYDDGWALCMRMDRSQQGVVPRTCLSKLPVKPRPQGPPPMGPNGRPMTPTGPPGTVPRPLTPTGAGRERAASVDQPQSPATAVPARKPVPGQAL